MTKDTSIQVRCTRAQKAILSFAARRMGISLSEYLRTSALEGATHLVSSEHSVELAKLAAEQEGTTLEDFTAQAVFARAAEVLRSTPLE